MPCYSADQDKRTRVLIVEDDDLQAQILAAALAAADFAVDKVGDGLAAMWKVREGRYDVVIVDYRLPEIDGYATAKLVCDFMGHAARPVLIALTATPEQLDYREIAFDAVVGKSSDFAFLFSVITSCLASAPASAARQEALSLLFIKQWEDYDTEPSRPGSQGDDYGPARILVIEDDECQQRLLTTILEQRGYLVESASNGLEAVCKIRLGCYDLALVDFGMPEMDGLATGRLVHDIMRQHVRPRLIALTATPDQLNDREGPSLSVFDEIIQKSSDLEGLMTSVDRHLKASPNPATQRAAVYCQS
jgi:CheY-like chemotaxis protein